MGYFPCFFVCLNFYWNFDIWKISHLSQTLQSCFIQGWHSLFSPAGLSGDLSNLFWGPILSGLMWNILTEYIFLFLLWSPLSPHVCRILWPHCCYSVPPCWRFTWRLSVALQILVHVAGFCSQSSSSQPGSWFLSVLGFRQDRNPPRWAVYLKVSVKCTFLPREKTGIGCFPVITSHCAREMGSGERARLSCPAMTCLTSH